MDQAVRQITERVRAAITDKTLLCIRGGGTKDFYGEPPQGQPLDTRALVGITSYEPSELVVTVRAGTPLAELESELAAKGQCLPFEPPRFEAAAPSGGPGTTVGGMVAAGLSGPARASVGAVRDYVLGATLVNGLGEVLTFGGQVMKNVAGYDVSRVLAGSMGTLGVIAELSLKVLPVAPAEATLRFECTQADALQLLNGWGGQPLPLNASRWNVEGGGAGVLYLRLRGAAAAVAAACARLGGERQDPIQAGRDWQAVRDLTWRWFIGNGAQDLWRLSVPQTAPVIASETASLIEWHGGQRWYLAAPQEGDALRKAAREAGGHATLFKATSGRAGMRFDRLSVPIARIHQALMREFDPHAVFDRGRLFQQG